MSKKEVKRQVKWNKDVYDKFCERAMLDEEDQKLLKTRIQGMYVSQQAILFNCSEATIHRRINKLKKLYDEVQSHYEDMPVRRTSKEEKIMDEN